MIKLEGGSDEDIKRLLDGPDTASAAEKQKSDEDDVKEIKNGGGEESGERAAKNGGAVESGEESGAYSEEEDENDDDDEQSNDNIKRKSKRKKRTKTTTENGNNSEANGGGAKTANGVHITTKQMHKTVSIFMRNLAPNITKQDLEEACKGYEGFKRIALSDPAPERGFYRRGWITFDADVDVKKICWSLSNIKVLTTNFCVYVAIQVPFHQVFVELTELIVFRFYLDTRDMNPNKTGTGSNDPIPVPSPCKMSRLSRLSSRKKGQKHFRTSYSDSV